MQFTYPIASLALLLSLPISIFAKPIDKRFEVDPEAIIPRASVTCPEYSQIANYTAIGLNSTLRGAFLQNSPAGTDPTRAILDTAQKKFLALNLKFDEAVNAECGNLTTLATTMAAENFTNGIVGPFTIKKTSAGERLNSAMGTVVLVATLAGAGLLL